MAEKYKIGKIEATNVAVGHKAAVNEHADPLSLQAEALLQLRNFVELLVIHRDKIASPDQLQIEASAAAAALQEPSLNRSRIQALVRNMTAGVAGVTALANAIDAVQLAVNHLFS